MALLSRPVTMMIDSIPEATAASTTYWINGLSTSGNISFRDALVAGRNRVPRPAAGKTALRTRLGIDVRFQISDLNIPNSQAGNFQNSAFRIADFRFQ